MEFSRNKIIFFIISWIVIFFVIVIIIIMLVKWNWTSQNPSNSGKNFTIWMVWDDWDTSDFINNFKTKAWVKNEIIVENFNSYEDYTLALTHAISSWRAPDIFVLNNNEKNSLFENQVLGISPEVLSVDYFRKNYKIFIAEQLISKTENWVEFLIGLPVWYETLWIFYNKRFINSSDVDSFSSIKNAISRIKQKNPNSVPFAIWNGSAVDFSEDILTQFILSEWQERSISSLSAKAIKSWIAIYSLFWDADSENAYNSRLNEMKLANQTWVDLFSRGDTFMLAWYPRLVNKIDKIWFLPSFLFAKPFPSDSFSKASLINYNYFVVNKDSKNIDLAEKFISYLASQEGSEAYFKTFPYYLPANTLFEDTNFSSKIHPKYNVKLWDFYDDSLNYTSFDKGIKTIYDEKIKNIIDEPQDAVDNFITLQKELVCKINKIINQTELSKSCDNK